MESTCQCHTEQMRRGKDFLHENSQEASSWKETCVRETAELEDFQDRGSDVSQDYGIDESTRIGDGNWNITRGIAMCKHMEIWQDTQCVGEYYVGWTQAADVGWWELERVPVKWLVLGFDDRRRSQVGWSSGLSNFKTWWLTPNTRSSEAQPPKPLRFAWHHSTKEGNQQMEANDLFSSMFLFEAFEH